MYISPHDRTLGDQEWRPFVTAQGSGHLVAAGQDRPVPVVVPTQFVLDGDRVVLHEAHATKLAAIRAVTIMVEQVRGKFKYGGNVDDAHRRAVAEHLDRRAHPGDRSAAAHLRRRSPSSVGGDEE